MRQHIPREMNLLELLWKALCFSHDASISELPWPIDVKLCHMIYISVQFVIKVQQFDGHKKLRGHVKFGSILHNFRLGRFYTTSNFDR